MESWIDNTLYNKGEEKYLKMIEKVFRVQDAAGNWDFIKLTPHQRIFHLNDLEVKGDLAESEVVVKSRNTSFTTSSIIRLLTGNYRYRDQPVPLVRINETKVKELIKEVKRIVKHMRPLRLKNGDLWPFDPTKVNTDNSLLIEFTDREVTFVGYPASASASENIRGDRIMRGLFDETNFCREFPTIHVAMRDAARGTIGGKTLFQVTYGTTLKGKFTPFNIWYTRMKKLNIPGWKMTYWPVYDPTKWLIEKARNGITFMQQKLIPIVGWHNNDILWNKFIEDEKTFLEEYMCEVVDDEAKFYSYQLILKVINPELKNYMTPPSTDHGHYFMGVDVAAINDYFVISIFEQLKDKYIQRHLFYVRKVELEDMMDHCCKIIELWKPIKCRIDGNGIGFQLAQQLTRRYGAVIDTIRSNKIKGMVRREKIGLNEYGHTRQKKMMTYNELELLNDELQIQHYSSWNYNFECDSTAEYGHGDICMANLYGLLPINFRAIKKQSPMVTNLKTTTVEPNKIVQVRKEVVEW